MFSIAVCDDETMIRLELIAKINDYLRINRIDGKITEFSRGDEIADTASSFDIVLLDIEMKGLDGMRTAARLRENGKECEIIFVTSHSSYVYDAFSVDASNFLVKPVSGEKLSAALAKAVKRVLRNENSPCLLVQKNGGIIKIRCCDILYCESVNHKLVIHTVGGVIDYYENIAELEKKLDDNFFRCHRSYIVNMSHIAAYEKDAVIFENGERALVSRRKAAELSQKLLETIRSEVV